MHHWEEGRLPPSPRLPIIRGKWRGQVWESKSWLEKDLGKAKSRGCLWPTWEKQVPSRLPTSSLRSTMDVFEMINLDQLKAVAYRSLSNLRFST
ncbi:hypothetical protein P7K49_039557 [Saguinus oedipus]|uniref:Uncharacterized protein n=1 Tax=Saguinus oedipus TaxID=9490 RepID=A0ABQ9TAL4_SAGOE|nr:hypothetical protein P7K49_039557 [Saguinus oedipus]